MFGALSDSETHGQRDLVIDGILYGPTTALRKRGESETFLFCFSSHCLETKAPCLHIHAANAHKKKRTSAKRLSSGCKTCRSEVWREKPPPQENHALLETSKKLKKRVPALRLASRRCTRSLVGQKIESLRFPPQPPAPRRCTHLLPS